MSVIWKKLLSLKFTLMVSGLVRDFRKIT
jgi:hypothetical protein